MVLSLQKDLAADLELAEFKKYEPMHPLKNDTTERKMVEKNSAAEKSQQPLFQV